MSIKAIEKALAHGITMVTFPPHCSHRLQPLDVTVFGPVKNAYEKQHSAWMKANRGEVLQIMHIPLFVKAALLKGATPENIVSGFSSTGICPYNPDVFKETDFAAPDEMNATAAEIEQQYNQDEQRRIVVLSEDIEVGAEESISASDGSITPSPSPSSSDVSRASSYASLVAEVGPLAPITPRPQKPRRGPQPKKTSILTSPEYQAAAKRQQENREAAIAKRVAAQENAQAKRKAAEQKKIADEAEKEVRKQARKEKKIADEAEKEAKKLARKEKKEAKEAAAVAKKIATAEAKKAATKSKRSASKKRKKISSSSSSDSDDSNEGCLVCTKKMPNKLTNDNHVKCHTCKGIAHVECVPQRYSIFVCTGCESGSDVGDNDEGDYFEDDMD